MRGDAKLYHLQLEGVSVYQQLQIEEALFRQDKGSWLITNIGSPPAVVFGISGRVEEHLDLQSYAKKPIPLIRRYSGGGTVVVDMETIFTSLIVNKSQLATPAYPKNVLHWTGELFSPLFPKDLFSIMEQDYAIEGKKIGGNAQSFAKERLVHHTTFLWNYSKAMMDLLKIPPRMPAYRAMRSHEEFLMPIKKFFPLPGHFLQGLVRELSRYFEVEQASLDDVAGLLQRPHRRATDKIEVEM